MKFVSLCSGIEAASVAWKPLGWKAVGFSEIEKFPSAVLAHHYPNVPNHGDMTKWKEWKYGKGSVDLVCGGTPCQSFSVAGLRKGLDDPRGNLMLVFLSILDAIRPRWVVWENVPGVLSSNGGRDFGAFLGGLGKLGYGWAYRVLDAQYIRVDGFERAVPQRRRRVFVVGCLGNEASAAAVLFEQNCLCGNPAPSRKAGKGFAADATTGSKAGSGQCQGKVKGETIGALCARDYKGVGSQYVDEGKVIPEIANCLTRRMHKGINSTADEGQTPIVAVGTDCYNGAVTGDVAATIGTPGSSVNASGPTVAFAQNTRDVAMETPWDAQEKRIRDVRKGVSPTLAGSDGGGGRTVAGYFTQPGMSVRRLTPVECERLMGFHDNYTRIPWRGKEPKNCPDGPRYKALGNSWAVNCARWVGTRIQMAEDIKSGKDAI